MNTIKKLLCAILAIMMIAAAIPVCLAASYPYTDVPAGSWHESSVAYCYEKGLMTGTGVTRFEPSTAMSRAMLVTVLHRMAGSPTTGAAAPFADVAKGSWFSNAVAWAYQTNVVNGTSPATFSPNTNITREQMVTIFYRYAMAKNYAISGYADLSGYSDSGKISVFAKAAFRWAVAEGIIQGTTSTTLSPAGTANRAQCAAIIQRFVEWVKSCESAANPPHTHDFKASSVINATCDASGYTVYTCSCGESQNRDSIPATGHAWGQWAVTKEPTCAEDGEKSRSCTSCGESETATVEKLSDTNEHTYEYWEFVYPTCISEGYEYRACVKCGHTEYGATFKPIDHDWGEWVTTKEPTTTEEGSANRVCSVCSAEETKTLPKHIHSYGDWIKVDSTCTEDGYYYQECECGYSETVETIAKKDHAYKMVASVDATCVAMGSETYECTGCGDSYTTETDMIAHDWIHTHTDEVGHWGDYLLVCTCGWSCSENEATSAGYDQGKYWSIHHQDYYGANQGYNDHSYSWKAIDWVVDTPAYDEWTCTGCGLSTTDHEEVTGHTIRSISSGTPTCKDGSYDKYGCRVCEYTYITNIQESTGHNWGAWEITQEVTAESRGWAIRTCTECNYDMGDYADLIDQHYHSYKPESQTVCIECGEDSIP